MSIAGRFARSGLLIAVLTGCENHRRCNPLVSIRAASILLLHLLLAGMLLRYVMGDCTSVGFWSRLR